MIDFNTSIINAKKIVCDISQHCNFWNIFRDNLGIDQIPPQAWKQIVQLNQFLSSINIDSIEIDILHKLLQSSVEVAKRKVAGQFATPHKIADLLTRLTIDNKAGSVLDPCCGTGTIIKQAYLLKEEYQVPENEIINKIWASDKHAFPIQLATLNLSRPNNIGEILHIFRSDVIDLKTGKEIAFKNPNTGASVNKKLPKIDYIVSNLPFIKAKEIKVLNPNIQEINTYIQAKIDINLELSGKSDIFAYIPFQLYKVLSKKGKIGLILSNAWLGTDYGDIFIELLQKFFNIETVVISGKGKWFNNAEVVTTLLIASKRDLNANIEKDNKEISFCTLLKNIQEIEDIKQLSDSIILREASSVVDIETYTEDELYKLKNYGLPWSSYFSNLQWLPNIFNKIIRANTYFYFTRGERRGWNAMFYPDEGHNIEPDYIRPVLKNLKNTKGLICKPNKEAFCCSKSLVDLELLGHNGAINWIRSFENQTNNTGVPLTESLSGSNMFWYEMRTNNMADYVANINYDKSLFVAQLDIRSFIDQRMIGLSIKEDFLHESKLLFLAILNSVLSLFFIESLGFGRGLGALDLRKTKFENNFSILNINLLSEEQKNQIIAAFRPIMTRDRLPLEEEIKAQDRIYFESILFKAFNISQYYDNIVNALLHLYNIRLSVKK